MAIENINSLMEELKVNGDVGNAKRDASFEELDYQRGFCNHFSTEVIKGALPVGQNSPLKCPYGLYAEQISGTAFTVPRNHNQRSWLYRIKPSVTHEPFHPREPTNERLVSDFSSTSAASVTPTQLRWKPPHVPEAETNFIDGLYTVCGSGSPFLRHGYVVHMYTANTSMEGCAFANADGDILIVPQLGRLWIKTEMGRIQVKPGEIVVVQLGIRFAVELPDGPSRGYVVEVFSGHFQLPDLGLIGANGLADPRDFLTPKAWFEEKNWGVGGFTVIHKFGGALFDAKQDFSPFNVVAWHGNYAPYKYNLKNFCPYNTVLFDHADPCINTVLTVPSERPGVAVVDFVVFPPRWSVAEHTFRPPYFHRNCMSEFMGLIYGMYEGKADGFLPGGASLHNCMTPHGVDTVTYERTICEDPKPSKIPDHALAFMFESSLIPRVTPWALSSPQLDPDYYKCWIGLRSHFDRANKSEAVESLSENE